MHGVHLHAGAGFLHHHGEFNRFFRLQRDDEPVGFAHVALAKHRKGLLGELDDDFRLAVLQAFARAQKERDLRPSRVVDVQAQRHKGFGAAVGWHVLFVQIAFHRLAFRGACGVLAAHRVALDVGQTHAAQGAQHFEFFVAHIICIQRDGLLHGDDAQQLQQMVLHHVAHRTCTVVKTCTAAHAHSFSHGDLHALDVRRPPQRLEDGVAKTQHHQVLHGFFAQVMVDPVNLWLVEILGHLLVDGACRGQVGAQGFFKHHPRLRIDQAGAVQMRTNLAEQTGRGGQIKHPQAWRVAHCFQSGISRCGADIHAHIHQALQKALPGGAFKTAGVDEAG